MSSTESICASVLLHLGRYDHPITRGLWSSSIYVISWEFICNLGFELSLLRARRQWRWTAAVSSPFPPITSRSVTADAFFFSTAIHRLSVFHHLSSGYGPHRFEYYKPIQLQGTLFSCLTSHLGSPHPSFSQAWLTFSLVCDWPLRSPFPSW